MAQGTFPTVNGFETSWADIKLTVDLGGSASFEVADCLGVKYDAKLSTSRTGGTSGIDTKETLGKVECSGSWTLTKSGVYLLKDALRKVAPKRNGRPMLAVPQFTVVIQHSDLINPANTYKTTLKGCRYRGESEDNKAGSDAVTNELDLGPLEVQFLINGEECVLL